MKALISDDNPFRLDYYRVLVQLGWVLYWANNPSASLMLLEKESPLDLVALDHDFRPADCINDPEEQTGRGVARSIAALPQEKRPRLVIIHSANAAGAKIMEDILRAAGVSLAVAPLPNIFVT